MIEPTPTPTEPLLIDTRKTAEYRRWEDSLHDVAAAAIDARIKHLQHGTKGDWRAVGEGVCELRFLQTGPGWRVYFHETNLGTLILLCSVAINRASGATSSRRRRYSRH